MRRLRTPLNLCGLLAGLAACSAAAVHAAAPDAIFVNGRFVTALAPGGRTPLEATALAVSAGRVVFVGGDAAARALAGPGSRVTDLHGAFAMPGFNDAHLHLADAGATALATDLRGVTSLKEMQARIASAAQAAPGGAWLRGGGWDHTLWPSAALPQRADLDVVTAGHPAFLERIDGHIAVLNSAALNALGLSAASADPPGGRLDRDAHGELTGIVRETALALEAQIPPPSAAQRRAALKVALADVARHGLTSVQDYSGWEDFRALEELERAGQLTARVSEWLTFNDPLPLLKVHRAAHPADDPLLHTGMLKGFMDGSLGSRTAALLAPYSDDPGNSGLARYDDQAHLDAMTVERAQAGFQIGFHAIGDRGVAMALHAFAAALAALPPAAREAARFRIEHDQVITPAELAEQQRLQVIASMQPSHLLSDLRWAAARLGPQRARYSYAWRSMLTHHIPLAFGTDYPVEAVSPLRGLYAAVTRLPEPGAGAPTAAYYPEQRLSIDEALAAYTFGSAFAEKMEHEKGTLEIGHFADFVVLDRDLRTCPAPDLLKARVLRTVVGGRTVYAADTPQS